MISRKLRYLSTVEKRILFVITGIVNGALIGLLVYYHLTGFFPPPVTLSFLILGSGLLGLGVQVLLFNLSRLINSKLKWQHQFALRFGLELGLNGLLAIIIGGLSLLLTLIIVTGSKIGNIWTTYWQSFLVLGVLTLVFVLVYTIITLLFYAQSHYAEGQIDELKAERKQIKLQFEALKSQLSPHYLFNSLNTISSLIYQDKSAAEEFIRRLAETYHYILSLNKKPLVPLYEELKFVQAYYFLLCVRYRDGLRLKVNIPEHLMNHQIPPMTLQILVENAIKHNSFSLSEPLQIELMTKNDAFVEVSNNKTQRPANVKSNKVGLKNIKLRYQYLTTSKVRILDDHDFKVLIPILSKTDKTVAA